MLAHLAESPLFRARDPRWAELWIASGIERNIELLDPELVKNYFRHSRHWNKDVTRPMHYDLIVNIGSMPLRAARDTIIAAYRAKFRRNPKPR